MTVCTKQGWLMTLVPAKSQLRPFHYQDFADLDDKLRSDHGLLQVVNQCGSTGLRPQKDAAPGVNALRLCFKILNSFVFNLVYLK